MHTLPSAARRLLPALLLVALGARADAQLIPLDDVWFKLSVKASGYAVHPATGAITKAQASAQAYLHLSLPPAPPDGVAPGVAYLFELWTKQDGGAWTLSNNGQHRFMGIASGNQLAVDMPMKLTLADGRFIDGRGVFRFDIKLDKQGFLKKARLSTVGGEVTDGSTDGTDILVGKLTAKGHDVSANKLPFTP